MASFGEKLRHEREMRGISLREIADATKISRRFLQALEEDRMDALPGGLFPRAFVRQYASFLGLDPAQLLADFAAAYGEPAAVHAAAVPVSRMPREKPRVNSGHLILGAIGLLLVVLGVGRPAADRQPAPAPSKAQATAPAVLPTDRVYPSPALALKESVAPSAGLVLTMQAEQDCWVEVRTDGTTVINRVLAEGESQTLAAQGEIVLSVGNAGGLRIRLNDRPALPLGKSGEVRKNIVITRQNLPSLVDEGRSASADGQSG